MLVVCGCKLFKFSFSPEPQGQFKPILLRGIFEGRVFKFVQMKGHVLFLMEIIIRKECKKGVAFLNLLRIVHKK